MERVDVAVVGGGPAGSSAARTAAEHGADAVVFEKGVPRADRPELGPDSTDAAGFLDYWVDIAELDVEAMPEGVYQHRLDKAEFIGPSETVEVTRTGIESSYDEFGFTFHRARLDDWLRSRAEDAGAEYRVGTSVRNVETDLSGEPSHTLTLADGSEVEAEYVILADGPQRQVTMPVLDQYLPEDRAASEVLSPRTVNHIAYQEYREIPEEVFEKHNIKFWWGWMPGETAYPWIFPNRDNVGRVGLTMPIGMDIDDFDKSAYRLLREDDDQIPSGKEYIRRLLEEVYGDEYDIEEDFPVIEEGYGKSKGTETYSISSTRPIDSPTEANIAVAGGAMGTTSAFHEGGDHVAMRTGALAGEYAAEGMLHEYNEAWKEAIGDELLRNVAIADVVKDYGPDDWDKTFDVTRRILEKSTGGSLISRKTASVGVHGLKLYRSYRKTKKKFANGGYVQLRQDEYQY
ncbi:NAD(P)/FAD-dependent oxidoreductase [Salarchaeum japonicum]|uniref:NAD(P)/FAD-dependent oxidoreductase n=1 Tax=Salarchaeum japonicum TaxID=555573 RepID=A0AAV3T152_9EURY|nr:NAD(P)/FAD-dependent oxidoreductase [Salarchaeum japonicum]